MSRSAFSLHVECENLELVDALVEALKREGYDTRVAGRSPTVKGVIVDVVEPAPRPHEIWSEGFRATGESRRAHLVGIIAAKSFQDACDRMAGIHGWDNKLYDRTKCTYWGCRLFDNELDARKSFG